MAVKMIYRLQTTLPEGEPSRRVEDEAEDGLYEEQLVDFEPSPSHTQTVLSSEIEADNEGEEEIIFGVVVGLKAIGGEMETRNENPLTVEIPDRESEEVPKAELVLVQTEEVPTAENMSKKTSRLLSSEEMIQNVEPEEQI